MEWVEKYFKLLDFWEKCDESVCMLFGGMKWRLMIVWVLVYELKLLILDELIVGVDIELWRFMWGFLE